MIIIRRAETKDVEGIVDVNLRTWRTTYTGIISEAFLSERESNRSERIERLKEAFNKAAEEGTNIYRFVAVEDEKVVGFVNYGKNRNEKTGLENAGEIYAIYVLEEYQRQGIGKGLINSSVKDLIADNYSSVVIWAFKDNPHVGFYKKIGGDNRLSTLMSFGDQDIEEIGFIYDDIEKLYEATLELFSK